MSPQFQSKISLALILAAFSLGALAPAARAAEVMLAPGITSQGQATASVGLALEWDKRWFESEKGFLTGYWSLAYTWWEGEGLGRSEHSLSVSPVLVYRFESDGWRPFVEVGIGAAYFSDERVGGRDLGSQAHFEDRLGLGVRISDRDTLRLRVIHYSNAGLEEPNDGINSWSLVYGRRF